MYRQQCGRKAEVVCERDNEWYGRFQNFAGRWVAGKWQPLGTFLGNSQNAIVGVWLDAPDPGEGWRLLEEGEVVEEGDEFWGRHTGWSRTGDVGRKHGGSHDVDYRRRRVPAPFRISDKGPANLIAIACSLEKLAQDIRAEVQIDVIR